MKINLLGQRVGRLTVVSEDIYLKNPGKHRKWIVMCDCGTEKSIFQDRLVKGTTVSCGCAQKDAVVKTSTTHGKSKKQIYKIWSGMLARCTNENNPCWDHYGGRGIKVCDSWLCFNNFFADMGDVPFVGASIDRTNNDLGYSKDNCRWATQKEQANNTRQNVFIEVNGVTKTVAQWADKCNLAYKTLSNRVKAGVSGSMLIAGTHRGVPHAGI